MKIKNFWFQEDMVPVQLDPMMSRKVLAHSEHMMSVELTMKKGGVAKLHQHVHEQMTYVVEGVFEFEVNGIKKIVKAGDALYMEPNVIHGMRCMESGKLVDIFTPRRDDLL
ncbi:MAG: cupin [Tenericutes bacterium GWA2_38_26]|nr:MAG: cupin [Tenericutes bacterium GWA2_38_26]